MTRRIAGIALIFLLFALPASAEASAQPTFIDAYVHDPSILKANGWYYIYGSHMAAAKSQDLMSWQMISTDTYEGCTLITDVQRQMKDALSWAKTDTFWAPSVVRLANGKYYMYYCTCEGSSPLSAMGLAVADSPEGPFEDRGVFLRSGMEGDGEGGAPYDATRDPNVIDAHAFYDKGGQLWMVYGSYSGGIYILKMDESTGLPVPGQGYGKKLLGKNHSRIEGPYILYAPDTDYYYLFLSFGGLDANGGYNIRVCRSRNPDGPYFDALGQAMIDCGGPDGSYFDDRAIAPYGVKLMGGFRFMPLEGVEPLPEQAYKSPGHNSAYLDPDSGRYFLVFHTRFSKLGDQFRDRVHEFWFNDEGWPVVSPLRYAGDAPGMDGPVSGGWRLLCHEKDVNALQHRSKAVTLNEDGTIAGELAGTWDASGSITLDGTTYQGRFSVGYDVERKAWVRTLTMLSSSGEALWGLQG
jgi:arabinan endo-1,5-alpha-L-arabinosidase